MSPLPLFVPLSWIAFFWAGPPVDIDGDSTCPTPAEVAPRLAGLLRPDAAAGPPDLARLSDRAGALFIQLQRPDGSPIGERALERGYPCADLAAAAAVILATWESDVHPTFRPTLAAPAAELRQPAPVTAPEAPTAMAFDVGGAIAGSLAPAAGSGGGAWGALLVGTLSGDRLGGRLAVQAVTERTLDLQAGTVHWRRMMLALGPQLRFKRPGRGPFVDLHVEAAGAWVSASGSGFATNHSDSSADLGLGAGVRLVLGGRSLAPWVDLSACGWLRHQLASTNDASVTLPRIEGTLALGLSFCACP